MAARAATLVSAFTALLAVSLPATASPLEDSTLGGAVFTGPVHGHASAMYINPAALGFTGRGWHLHLGSSLRLSSVSIDRLTLNPDTGATQPGPKVSATTLSPGGIAAWYMSFRDNEAHFGFSFYLPSYERFLGGEDLRYHSLGGEVAQGLVTLAGAYRFAGRFIFGIGFSMGYTQVDYRYDRDTALEDGSAGLAADCGGSPCGFENPAAAERVELQVGTSGPLNGFFALKNVAASVGLAARVHGGTWVSLSYAGLPGAFGELDLRGEGTVTTAPRDGAETLRGDAEITLRMPHTVYAGVRHPLGAGYDLVGAFRWQDLSRQDQFDVRLFGGDIAGSDVPEWQPRYRGFSDVYRLGVGIEGDASETFRLGGRLRFETGAVDAARVTPIQVAGPSLTVATGAELRFSEHFVVSAGYELGWFLPLDADESDFDPRDRVACVDSQYDFDQCRAVREGRALPTAAGHYRRLQHGFVLSLRYDSL